MIVCFLRTIFSDMNDIGFGCSRLTSNFSEKQAVNNLEVAFDNGISHFDVARLYGFGLAEGILGKFAQNKRDKITITTKFGLFANNSILKNLFLQNILRSVFRSARKLPLRGATQKMADQTILKKFDVKAAQASLETSLRELSTDYVDYLLLHEADVGEANNEELISFLEIQKTRGNIKSYGVGSFSHKILHDFSSLSTNYKILQTDNSFPETVSSVMMRAEHIEKRFYFSPLAHFQRTKRLFSADPAFARLISRRLGFAVEIFVLDLFLMHQTRPETKGTFLFASSNSNRIRETVERWNYVNSISKERYKDFEDAGNLIREKLFYDRNEERLG